MVNPSAKSDFDASMLVVMNPGSGGFSSETVHQALQRHLPCEDGSCQVHELAKSDDLHALIENALKGGCRVIVAAGGDGTVSAVADSLVGKKVSLGIIPLGTANVLAKELGVPVDLDQACLTLRNSTRTRAVDVMEVSGKHYTTQVGIGLDAQMIRDTRTEAKKRFGRLAYLWSAAAGLLGLKTHRYEITIDGRIHDLRATQILVANCGTLGQKPFLWGPNILPDDGHVDLCVVHARSLKDVAGVAWHFLRKRHGDNPNVHYFQAKRSIKITRRTPQPVQADGEIIGKTPIEVRVIPAGLRVIVP